MLTTMSDTVVQAFSSSSPSRSSSPSNPSLSAPSPASTPAPPPRPNPAANSSPATRSSPTAAPLLPPTVPASPDPPVTPPTAPSPLTPTTAPPSSSALSPSISRTPPASPPRPRRRPLRARNQIPVPQLARGCAAQAGGDPSHYFNRRRRSDQALADLNESVQLSPENRNVLCLLGECYEQKGVAEDVRRAFESALKIDASLTPAREGLQRLSVASASS